MTYEVYAHQVRMLCELTLEKLKAAKTEQEKLLIMMAQNEGLEVLVSAYDKWQEDQKSKKEE